MVFIQCSNGVVILPK